MRTPRGTVRVLLSTDGPDGTTKFVDQLVSHPGQVQHEFFGWRRALLGGYDVFHVHWPESLVRSRSRAVRTARRIATLLLLVRLHLTGTVVVRTMHNTRPHRAGDRVEDFLVDALDRLVSGYVCLNELTETRPDVPRFLIPHGSYHEPFERYPKSPHRSGLLFFGRIDAYKGVDALVRAFSGIDDPALTLRVIGQPHGDVSAIRAAATADTRISFDFAFVPDDRLVTEVSAAQLAVLPYRHLENSGVLFVAVSLGTPVLAPHSPTAALLRDEFGDDWVRLYHGDLDTATLLSAAQWASAPRGTPPTMPTRTWTAVGAAHEAAYRELVKGRR